MKRVLAILTLPDFVVAEDLEEYLASSNAFESGREFEVKGRELICYEWEVPAAAISYWYEV